MSKVYSLKSYQKIPVGIEQAWAFFSNPSNLLSITPPFLNLKVTNDVFGTEAYPGQIITYSVKPLLGIPLFWMTEITQVVPFKMFVDEQRKGPYKLWHHQHHFTTIEGGVAMTDLVHYRLPMGFAGDIANALFVKNKLKQIFSFRYKKVNELLGEWPGQQLDLQLN